MRLILPLAASLTLIGCGDNTACYGLSDNDFLSSAQRAYAGQPVKPEVASNRRLDRWRVLAVERGGAKGEDAHIGMLFRQDDGSLLLIRRFEDCTFTASFGVKASSLNNWAYKLSPPRL
jgi:hypothetical protein